MKVIVDSETAGVFTRCLAINWHLPEVCQIDGCSDATYAIVRFTKDETPEGHGALTVTICKKHYEESVATGMFDYKINFKEEKVSEAKGS